MPEQGMQVQEQLPACVGVGKDSLVTDVEAAVLQAQAANALWLASFGS